MLDLGSAVGYLMLDTSKWTSGLQSARSGLQTFQDESATTADKFSAMGSALTSTGKTMTVGVTAPLVGIGTACVKTAAEFEKGMSQVQATMGITADSIVELSDKTITGAEAMKMLENAAKEQGATTSFSAKEAADGLNYLALAGYDVEQQIAALPQVLTLAAAGDMDLAYASDLVTDSMSVLGLTTKDLGGFIDQMAVTASNSNTSVAQLGEAILVAGGQASLCGMNTNQLNTALGILANNGIKGSEGGTMLRNVLKNLYTPTEAAAKVMDQLGIVTAKSDGSLRETKDVLRDLSHVLSEMTEEERVKAMAQIFDTRTIAGANALLENCTDAWDDLSEAIGDAEGAAKQMADTQLDNLEGQLTILGSAVEGAAIAFGQILIPMIVPVIQKLQEFFSWLTNLNEGTQRLIVTIGIIAAAIGPILIIIGQISTGIGAIISLISGGGGLAAALSVLTGPVGIVIAAVVALTAAWVTNFMGIRNATMEVILAIGEFITNAMAALRNAWENDLNGIRTVAEAVWNLIKTVFETAFSIITALFGVFAAAFRGDWQGLWDAVKNLVQTIWEGIKALIDAALSAIIAIIVGIAGALYNAARTAFTKIKEGFQNVWDTIKAWFNKAKEDPVEAIKGLGSALYNAAKNAFTKLLDGFKSIWTNISNWVTEKVNWIRDKFQQITSFGSSIGASSVSGGGRSGGSYASGLDYVPRDMNVRVHEGEAIITAQENRNRTQNSGGNTFNFYSPEALTPVKAAREFKRVSQELALGFI